MRKDIYNLRSKEWATKCQYADADCRNPITCNHYGVCAKGSFEEDAKESKRSA